jgi:hypothetical protein
MSRLTADSGVLAFEVRSYLDRLALALSQPFKDVNSLACQLSVDDVQGDKLIRLRLI